MKWSEAVSAILEIIGDPTSNLTAAVTLLSAAVLVVLILLVLAMVVVLSRGARGRKGPAKRTSSTPSAASASMGPSRRGRTRSPALSWIAGHGGAWLIAGASVAVLLSGYVATSQDVYCTTCHSDDHAESRPEGAHADVSCVRCHEDSWAVAGNVVLRVSDVAARYGLGHSQYVTTPRSSRCLSCHRGELREVREDETSGIRVSHSQPLEAGWGCTDCHSSESHGDMASPIEMSECLPCHDALQVSAECSTCHAKDTSAASGLAAKRIYGMAKITRADCEGCHSQESCDACHGIRMPHSQEFLDNHPRYSGFDKKELCYEKCHTKADCGKCHGAWSSHIPSFKEEHKRYPKDSACNSCHGRHEGPICDLCHDFNTGAAQ